MQQVNLKEASTQLAELIEAAASGEEVVITRNDGSSFKLVQIGVIGASPKFGSAKGLVRMSEDFDETLEHFEEYDPRGSCSTLIRFYGLSRAVSISVTRQGICSKIGEIRDF